MSFTTQSIVKKSDISKYDLNDDKIYRNLIRKLVFEAPMADLVKIFSLTKSELNDSEFDFRAKI